jgi:hypothetical protein
MKKILSALILISFLVVLIIPQVVSAVMTEAPKTCKITRDLSGIDEECVGTSKAPKEVSIEDYGMCCLVNTLYNITDWIFVILVGLAGIFIIIGAMTLMTAAGDPSKVASGRNYIMYAAIGLIVAFLAKAVPNMVKMIGGIGG